MVPRAKQRTPQLREQVLDGAMSLLARDGVTGFTARSVAREAQTSVPAVYELFGDKRGLLREVFFAGFRALRTEVQALTGSGDPRADLLALITTYRQFVIANPVLAQLMFSRPFSDFDPGPDELRASAFIRTVILECVQRCQRAGLIYGDASDVTQVLVALVQGLAAAEASQRLGSSQQSVDRRWELGINTLLAGFASSTDH